MYNSLNSLPWDNIQSKNIIWEKLNINDFSSIPIPIVSSNEPVYKLVTRDLLRDIAFDCTRLLSFFLPVKSFKQMNQDIENCYMSFLCTNASISSSETLPLCQDTGIIYVYAKRGNRVLEECDEDMAITEGCKNAFANLPFRYSTRLPNRRKEISGDSNMPIFIDKSSVSGNDYSILFAAKGGGSINETRLFHISPGTSFDTSCEKFIEDYIQNIGGAGCPPLHIGVAIGGINCAYAQQMALFASLDILEDLPSEPNDENPTQPFRDKELEIKLIEKLNKENCYSLFTAQYVASICIVRLSRHSATCPLAIDVSCSAHRRIRVKITPEGVYREKLYDGPFVEPVLPSINDAPLVDLSQPMEKILKIFSKINIGQYVLLNGPAVMARDLVHRSVIQSLKNNEPSDPLVLFKTRLIYYAGPAKKHENERCGACGPTTTRRMDIYMEELLKVGAGKLTMGKGGRGKETVKQIAQSGGYYLQAIGGGGALYGRCISSMEIVGYPEFGMEALRSIVFDKFPAFLASDDIGNCIECTLL